MCGKTFTPKRNNRAKFCSPKCSSKHARLRNPEKHKEYEKKRASFKAIYLKEYLKEYIKTHPPKKKPPKEPIDIKCIECGTIFKGKGNRKYCFKQECINKRNESKPKTCRYCGVLFNNKRIKNKLYCSDKCTKSGLNIAVKIGHQKRKARHKELEHTFTAKQWKETLSFFNNSCAYCGVHNSKSRLHQDHVIPLSKGGEYTHNNIIPACFDCNVSKSANTMHAWYNTQSFYSPFREKKINNYLGYKDINVQQVSMM